MLDEILELWRCLIVVVFGLILPAAALVLLVGTFIIAISK